MKIIPTGPEFVHEALIIIGGALIAAIILSKLPEVRDYIRTNTNGTGCNCGH